MMKFLEMIFSVILAIAILVIAYELTPFIFAAVLIGFIAACFKN